MIMSRRAHHEGFSREEYESYFLLLGTLDESIEEFLGSIESRWGDIFCEHRFRYVEDEHNLWRDWLDDSDLPIIGELSDEEDDTHSDETDEEGREEIEPTRPQKSPKEGIRTLDSSRPPMIEPPGTDEDDGDEEKRHRVWQDYRERRVRENSGVWRNEKQEGFLDSFV